MNPLTILFIILAIGASIGGIEVALSWDISPGPYIPPHHEKFVIVPHTPEVLTIPTYTTQPTGQNRITALS
jgi:hypothetical protein